MREVHAGDAVAIRSVAIRAGAQIQPLAVQRVDGRLLRRQSRARQRRDEHHRRGTAPSHDFSSQGIEPPRTEPKSDRNRIFSVTWVVSGASFVMEPNPLQIVADRLRGVNYR